MSAAGTTAGPVTLAATATRDWLRARHLACDVTGVTVQTRLADGYDPRRDGAAIRVQLVDGRPDDTLPTGEVLLQLDHYGPDDALAALLAADTLRHLQGLSREVLPVWGVVLVAAYGSSARRVPDPTLPDPAPRVVVETYLTVGPTA